MEAVSSNPAVWAGFEAPDDHLLAWRVVRPDGRSRNDFLWKFKGVMSCARANILKDNTGPCPQQEGDGLCLAKTWAGAASGGIAAITGLAVTYRPRDILGENREKLRVRRCVVLGPIDLHRSIRAGKGRGANLGGANLRRANLGGANLYGALNDPGTGIR